MGCGHSVNNNNKQIAEPTPRENKPPVVPSINPKDFKVSAADFVKNKSTKFADEYKVKNRLGEGAYGEVSKVIHKASGMIRAVKVLKKDALDEEETTKIISELQILTTLDHPNIMKVYEMFEDSTKYYIVSEFLEGGELFDKLVSVDRFSEKEAAVIMKQILSAVSYSHQHNIAHRDLKPENLVYETKEKNANLKVIDFGTAGVFKPGEKMDQPFGTAYYVAPEVLTESYTEKCDIWSCGVILYILLSGKPPFEGRDDEAILKKVTAGQYDLTKNKIWAKISQDAKNFIQKMLEMDVKKRYSAEQALRDPWIISATSDTEGKFDQPLAVENLRNLQNFGFQTKFQEAAWVFLTSFFASKEEKKKLLDTFKALDKNNDGQLSKEELRHGYAKIMELSPDSAEEEAERILNTLDANKSGKIDYSEFVNAAISKEHLLQKQNLEAAFKLIDKNGDGKISSDEMKFLFNEGKACGLPSEVWGEWIGQADKNADGGISLEEFKVLMTALITKN